MMQVRQGVVAVWLAVALGACSVAAGEPELVQLADGKWGDGQVQHSTEIMTERLPALIDMESVTYYIGGQGKVEWVTDRITVPGPTDYWLDAVVTLPNGAVASLLDTVHDAHVASDAPDVVPHLSASLPAGDLWWSPTLNEHITTATWHGHVYLSPATDQAVLVLYTT
ncbi:MAG: hypothetical protein CVT64_08575 [Actinobacteria bacterium HGW-Actinobacteria-4]|nr:MAG: hypothetical protein CVT64_08575 [Actinobacteria bacterium HGW-Actinobacteria-4]